VRRPIAAQRHAKVSRRFRALVQFLKIIVQVVYAIIVINAMTNPCIFTVPSCMVLLRLVHVVIVVIVVCTRAIVVVIGRPSALLHVPCVLQLHAVVVVLLVLARLAAPSTADPDLVDFVKRRERRGRDAVGVLEQAERRRL
jgi:hypothetical protein